MHLQGVAKIASYFKMKVTVPCILSEGKKCTIAFLNAFSVILYIEHKYDYEFKLTVSFFYLKKSFLKTLPLFFHITPPCIILVNVAYIFCYAAAVGSKKKVSKKEKNVTL